MNLRQLVASTRQVKTNMWDPNKDFRSREFGQIIDFNIKGNYNPRFKTLTVTMYIKSKTQNQRHISSGLGDSVISTHTAAITFKDIVQHIVYIQEYTERYNSITNNTPITSVQDIINKMQQSQPDLVPVEITDEYIVFRTKVDFNTECRVKCTCAHFYYTFAYYCAQSDAYIGDAVAPYKVRRKLKGKVKYRNSNGVPGLCKHLQLLITHILKTDNGINGNMEYANAQIEVPSSVKKIIQPNDQKNNLNRILEVYEKNKGLVAENRSNYIKLALRELRQFNSAVRQQKSENHNLPDKSEIDNNGRY
jgi:hypothetical protein